MDNYEKAEIESHEYWTKHKRINHDLERKVSEAYKKEYIDNEVRNET